MLEAKRVNTNGSVDLWKLDLMGYLADDAMVLFKLRKRLMVKRGVAQARRGWATRGQLVVKRREADGRRQTYTLKDCGQDYRGGRIWVITYGAYTHQITGTVFMAKLT